MKVLIATGSPRPHGNTDQLVRYLSDELTKGGGQVRRVDLHGLAIAPCLGCYRCQNVFGAYGCVQHDDMQSVVDEIVAADVLVFATPIYTWQATAPMKAMMDRMYGLNKFYGDAPRQVLNAGQKYALLASCGYDPATYGADLLSEGLRRWCEHSGLTYLGMYAVRDEDDLASFRTPKAEAGCREFARRLLAAGPRHA